MSENNGHWTDVFFHPPDESFSERKAREIAESSAKRKAADQAYAKRMSILQEQEHEHLRERVPLSENKSLTNPASYSAADWEQKNDQLARLNRGAPSAEEDEAYGRLDDARFGLKRSRYAPREMEMPALRRTHIGPQPEEPDAGMSFGDRASEWTTRIRARLQGRAAPAGSIDHRALLPNEEGITVPHHLAEPGDMVELTAPRGQGLLGNAALAEQKALEEKLPSFMTESHEAFLARARAAAGYDPTANARILANIDDVLQRGDALLARTAGTVGDAGSAAAERAIAVNEARSLPAEAATIGDAARVTRATRATTAVRAGLAERAAPTAAEGALAAEGAFETPGIGDALIGAGVGYSLARALGMHSMGDGVDAFLNPFQFNTHQSAPNPVYTNYNDSFNNWV